MASETTSPLRRVGRGLSALDLVVIRRCLHACFPLKMGPRRIALGVSIGVFVAFTPSIGFQMGIALVIASMLNASRLAAVACVWLTNPLTMGPVFAFTCLVGRPFWFSSHEAGFSQISRAISGGHHPYGIGAVFHAFQSMFGLGPGLFMPMLIGGLIIGSAAGGLCYYPTKSIAKWYQHARRRKTRASRRVLSRHTGAYEGTHTMRRGTAATHLVSESNPKAERRRAA